MSFEFQIDEKSRKRSELIGQVGQDLQASFVFRKAVDGTTQTDVADALGVDKSRVNRCLSGHANLTLGALSDLIDALKAEIIIKIVPREQYGEWRLIWTRPEVTATANNNVEGLKSSAPAQGHALQIASGSWHK